MRKMRRTFLSVIAMAACCPCVANAWNALGHKVVCAIAWREIDSETQKSIVDTLKRHPRFAEDFISKMPAIDPADEWIFQQSGAWPDIARGIRGPDREKFDRPIWHYINYPVTLDGFPEPKLNLASNPADNKSIAWNIAQATEFCLEVTRSKDPPAQKALAYSWLMHLVADMHQPMHSTALFCERFPKGDRGGNSIKTRQGRNLHSLWDNLLGRSHEPNDVLRELAQLEQRRELWNVDTSENISGWIAESHELAKSFAYTPEVLEAVGQPGELIPVNLPTPYLKEAGGIAQGRIVAAGLRLARLLGGEPRTRTASQQELYDEYADGSEDSRETFESREHIPNKPDQTTRPAVSHWLNTNSNVRHNRSCKNFENTKNGRYCAPDEGRPCGICGG